MAQEVNGVTGASDFGSGEEEDVKTGETTVKFQRKEMTLTEAFDTVKGSDSFIKFGSDEELAKMAERAQVSHAAGKTLTVAQVEALYYTGQVAQIEELRKKGEITERTRYGRIYRLRLLLVENRRKPAAAKS